MATTKEQLIKIYQEKLANASNKKTALEEIIRDLNNRVYSDTQKPVNNDFKKSVLEELRKYEIIKHSEIFAQTDNDYLELLQSTIEMLGGK